MAEEGCRRRFATRLLEPVWDIRTVRELLGPRLATKRVRDCHPQSLRLIAHGAVSAARLMRSDRPQRKFLHVPTVLRVAGFRFYFWSRENREPPHVHMEQAERYAKFWLSPVLLADARGFRSHELSELRRLFEEHATSFEEKWHEHLRSQGPSGQA